MVDFKAKHAAANVPSGEEAAARIGQSGEIVDLSLLWQLTLEGRVFYGGHGIEETATSTFNGTLDECESVVICVASQSRRARRPIVGPAVVTPDLSRGQQCNCRPNRP